MFKGLGQLGDMAGIMKRAQEMQTKMAEAQARLETIEVEGAAGAGMVSAIVTAKGRLVRLAIDPTLLDPGEKAVAEDLIVAAIRDAQEKAAERAQEEIAKVTEGLGLPAGMKLPF